MKLPNPSSLTSFFLLLATLATAVRYANDKTPARHGTHHLTGWEQHPSLHAPNGTTGNSTFSQYIDHSNAGLGTFSQFYYWSSEFWGGPGSPVILFTPGEVAVEGYQSYMTVNRTTGVVAREIGAAVVVLEHRYWGWSSPFEELTTDNMTFLTLNQSISDLTHFAEAARLPFDPRGSSKPTKAPWLLMGGSYSGALSAWTASTQPGTFWAYYASSSPVQAIEDYWGYFYPVQLGMPQNCSTDVSLVISHIDSILLNGTAAQKLSLKAQFGLETLSHDDDFASALENGPWLWQGNQFYTNSGFFDFCDAVENAVGPNATVPGAEGVGLGKALAGYAQWFNGTFLPGYCESFGYSDWAGTYNTACFDTYNASSPMYTDLSVGNALDRQWEWFLCNEPFGYWQDGAPPSRPSIVSRLVTVPYSNRQCGLFFPSTSSTTVGIDAGASAAAVNAWTGGWNITAERLLWVNGDFDPWREASVSADFRPGGALASTEERPVVIVPGGFHTSDLITRNGDVNEGVKGAIDTAVAQMVDWVAEWPGSG